jgi:nitrogen fixation NifU-like protein
VSIAPELRELYQEVIVDHGRRPRNFRRIAGATRSVEGYNPLCGDQVTLDVELEGDRVKDVAFQGKGCAISMASASVMTEVVKGRTRAEAEALFERFHRLVTEGGEDRDGEDLGKLAVFAGVREFPARVKCAVLAWHTLRAALEGKTEPVSTE